MIIVSQDKREIVNFENITSLYIKKQEKLYGIFYINKETEYILGWYKTDKIAIKVLNKIIEQYKDYKNGIAEANYCGDSYFLSNNIIFKMPENEKMD